MNLMTDWTKKTDHACELICETCWQEFFSRVWLCPKCGSDNVELISKHEAKEREKCSRQMPR